MPCQLLLISVFAAGDLQGLELIMADNDGVRSTDGDGIRPLNPMCVLLRIVVCPLGRLLPVRSLGERVCKILTTFGNRAYSSNRSQNWRRCQQLGR